MHEYRLALAKVTIGFWISMIIYIQEYALG